MKDREKRKDGSEANEETRGKGKEERRKGRQKREEGRGTNGEKSGKGKEKRRKMEEGRMKRKGKRARGNMGDGTQKMDK